MKKLEQLHLEAITQADYDLEDEVPNYVEFASKSAEITEQIAIEFADWVLRFYKNDLDYKEFLKIGGFNILPKSTKEKFQEFLKTKQ